MTYLAYSGTNLRTKEQKGIWRLWNEAPKEMLLSKRLLCFGVLKLVYGDIITIADSLLGSDQHQKFRLVILKLLKGFKITYI